MAVFTFTPAHPEQDLAQSRRERAKGGRFTGGNFIRWTLRRPPGISRGPAPGGARLPLAGSQRRFGKRANRAVSYGRTSASPGMSGWLRRKRRLAIALLLCIATGIAVHQLTPAPTDTVTVLGAARDLPAGATLGPMDLAELHIPPALMVDGTFSHPPDLTGKQLASPVLKGQILAATQLLGQGLLAGTAEGFAAVPVRMADPASIQLLSPGQLVNIVKSSDTGYGSTTPSEVLAEAVAVLWTSGKGGQSTEWLGSGETEGLVVVAASPAQAQHLAGASSQGNLFFVMVGAGAPAPPAPPPPG